MTASEIFEKVCEKLSRTFSYRTNIRRLAYHLGSYSIRLHTDDYSERVETGPRNIETKYDRLRQGGPLEPHSVAVINKAAAQLLGSETKILEIGSGTGMFSFLAAENQLRTITASELDEATRQWAIEHRNLPNIQYCAKSLQEFGDNAFEVAVAVEVIEHVADYSGFLSDLSRVAPTAIITTPNKNRSPMDSIANTPPYSDHVREWTAGEFYWVLRAFYSNVTMYTVPNFRFEIERHKKAPQSLPALRRSSVLEHSEPLLALCAEPNRIWREMQHRHRNESEFFRRRSEVANVDGTAK
jgi:ubiquinone/menaquinone biosynthesis C-methylase UbiE